MSESGSDRMLEVASSNPSPKEARDRIRPQCRSADILPLGRVLADSTAVRERVSMPSVRQGALAAPDGAAPRTPRSAGDGLRAAAPPDYGAWVTDTTENKTTVIRYPASPHGVDDERRLAAGHDVAEHPGEPSAHRVALGIEALHLEPHVRHPDPRRRCRRAPRSWARHRSPAAARSRGTNRSPVGDGPVPRPPPS